jgi:sialate O-acetylesterase
MRALIGGWREVWGQGEFPFYYVQLAPFDYSWGGLAALAGYQMAEHNLVNGAGLPAAPFRGSIP